MIVKFRHKLTVQQQAFIDAMDKEQLYGGAKRGGKTVAGCLKSAMLALEFPGNRGFIGRKWFPDLRDSTLTTFRQVCPRELYTENESKKSIRFPHNGSEILYGGLGDKSEIEKAKGKEFGFIYIDEPSEIDEQVYLMLLAQLCWQLPDGSFPPFMALLTSNPEPGWVHQRFSPVIESASGRHSDHPGMVFIRSLPRDNPYLPPGWENELRLNFPVDWVKKYLDGSWEVSEGMVFTEFSRSVHCIDPLPPEFLRSLKLVGALDHATTGTSAFLIVGFDSNGNDYAIDEHYAANRLISEHSASIHIMLDRYREIFKDMKPASGHNPMWPLEYCLIDPSTTARTLQGRNQLDSVQNEYARQGIFTVGAHNALEAGINLLKERLHVQPGHIHPFRQERGSPTLFIVESQCPGLVKEMMQLRKEVLPSGHARYLGADHALDCLRYVLLARPRRPEQKIDTASIPPQDRFLIKSHQMWANRFGQQGNPGSWF